MEKTLILFAHPALERSRTNRALLDAVSGLEGVTVNDLYEEYPDFQIDREREKTLLEAHDRVVWQHPFYWYSTPALMKEWFDVVLEYGWAYGKGGTALVGKRVLSVLTAGAGEQSYSPEGHNRHTIEELLRPLERTARLCGMEYLRPMVVYDALHLDGPGLAAAGARYRELLENG